MTSRTRASPRLAASPSIQQAIGKSAQRIITLLEEGRAKTTLSRSDFFTRGLVVWDATLRQADLDEFLNGACVGVEKAMHEIALAFDELFAQAMNNYYDILGATFMLAHLAWKDVGDEYTPWDLVQLIVRLTLADFQPPQPGEPPVTVYDPCCGSGAFLLGCLEYIDGLYPEVLDRGQVKLYGQELTHVGWLMCRINLHLHQLARVLRRRETDQQRSAEPTQAAAGFSAVQVQQESLWTPADIVIDEGMRQKLLATARPLLRPRSKKKASQQPQPGGPSALFIQAEELFPADPF